MNTIYDRFKDAPWFRTEDVESVVIGGAGGIGSWLSFFLARAGFNLTLYDFDRVERHNIGGQLFTEDSVGRSKTSVVSHIIKQFCGTNISTFAQPVDQNTMTHYFMFGAFDNMEARRAMFDVWKRSIENCPITPILIDGRIEAEQLQIFCVTPEFADAYEENHLFSDASVPDLPCTLKQTSHTAAMVASHMTAFFTNHLTNIYSREIVREVPYYYEYFIPANLTESYERP